MKMLKRNLTILLLLTVFSKVSGQDFVFVRYFDDHEKFNLSKKDLKKDSTLKYRRFFEKEKEKKEFTAFKESVISIDVVTRKINEVTIEIGCSDLKKFGIILDRTAKSVNLNRTSNILIKWDRDSAYVPFFDSVKYNSTSSLEFLDLSKIMLMLFPPEKKNNKDWFTDPKAGKDTYNYLCNKAAFGGFTIKIGNLTARILLKSTDVSNFPSIEPRQYVTIYEKKNAVLSKDGSLVVDTGEPIWWLVKDKDPIKKDLQSVSPSPRYQFYPHQKHRVISDETVLEIRFDNEALANNIDFHGSISLVAKAGEKKIEVAPYSVIGQDQKDFGVDAMPIKEIADYFLRLIIEEIRLSSLVSKFDGVINLRKRQREFNQTDDTKKEISATSVLEEAITTIESTINAQYKSKMTKDSIVYGFSSSDPLTTSLESLRIFFPEDAGLMSRFINQITQNKTNIKPPVILTYGDLVEYLAKIKLPGDGNKRQKIIDYQKNNAKKKGQLVNFDREILDKAKSTSLLCIDLLKRIDDSNDQSINAFLSLTTLTITDFNNMATLSSKIRPKIDQDGNTTDSLMAINIKNCEEIFKSLINSSVLFNDLVPELSDQKNDRNGNVIKALLSSEERYNRIRDAFAHAAGKEIFKMMVYATIDLSKANLPDGSPLDIAIMWYNAEGQHDIGKDGSPKTGSELWTASFIVKKTGWHFDFAESAILIQRIGENKLRGGNYPLSPSNFKPTAGASMLWSFYNPHRTITRVKQSGFLIADKNVGVEKEYGFLKFVHWLEPSFGLNVSYLDFRTDRDVEFGAGPIIGFFQNRIFYIPWGYNFSVDGESPTYMGIGFSFSNIFSKIQSNVNK